MTNLDFSIPNKITCKWGEIIEEDKTIVGISDFAVYIFWHEIKIIIPWEPITEDNFSLKSLAIKMNSTEFKIRGIIQDLNSIVIIPKCSIYGSSCNLADTPIILKEIKIYSDNGLQLLPTPNPIQEIPRPIYTCPGCQDQKLSFETRNEFLSHYKQFHQFSRKKPEEKTIPTKFRMGTSTFIESQLHFSQREFVILIVALFVGLIIGLIIGIVIE